MASYIAAIDDSGGSESLDVEKLASPSCSYCA